MNMDTQSTVAVEDKLGLIQRVMHSGDYDVAVKECCTLFELVFRKIFQQAVASLPFKDRDMILEVERKIGKGVKGAQDFGFGELVGLFRESKLMEKWSKHTSRNLGIIQTLDYAEIVNLRNRITHNGASCSRGEANLVFEYLRNFLAVLGFADLDNSINQSFKKDATPEPYADAANAEAAAQGTGLPQLRPQLNKSEGARSLYSPAYGNEKERLRVQGNNYLQLDLRAFREVLEAIPQAKGLLALDLGCAGGQVTTDRFNRFDVFGHVVGVDVNADKIREAGDAGYGEKYTFVAADVESEEFEEQIRTVLDAHGREQFDFIFSALTLHHLTNPHKALFKLRKLVRPGGFIYLRGSDDGSKLAYPDEMDLVRHVIRMTQEVEGASDRENGRKLYPQLWKSGFHKIRMLYEVLDTAGRSMDERLALFQGSFSYRVHNFKKRLDREPDNAKYREEYQWMKDALEELELQFVNEAFFYQETVYAALAQK